MNPKPTASAGFTLIELSLVVVLLSVFTFLAVRSLDNLLPRHRMEAGARDLAATIRTARDQAIL
ncbi:MAG: prepilin-type N-terminal cleavage/methylation domain-containing protein, partial [Planctomycetota bacterium]|nr:prepilin-type N-terminal cleavage/methylation domain-containing protein [Planctomycetota bacterium]